MAVAYSDIYGIFSNMTSDYKHLQLPTEIQDAILFGWLISAITTFDSCVTDLSDRDDIFQQFNQDLMDEEKDILARLMVVEWLSPKLYSVEMFQNRMTPKDWNVYSPANLLREIRETYILAKAESRGRVRAFAHKYFDLSTLTNK
jgi:hypothetical protein